MSTGLLAKTHSGSAREFQLRRGRRVDHEAVIADAIMTLSSERPDLAYRLAREEQRHHTGDVADVYTLSAADAAHLNALVQLVEPEPIDWTGVYDDEDL